MTDARVAPTEANNQCSEEWTSWKHRFDCYRVVSGLDTKEDAAQINILIYCMGDDEEDILASFNLSAEEANKYSTVQSNFDSHFNPRKHVILKEQILTHESERKEETERELQLSPWSQRTATPY